MTYKQNCWEYKNCGLQPGGHNTANLGVCPVPQTMETHEINQGINAGRACWAIEMSLCDGKVNGTVAEKIGMCMECDFYATVRREEGVKFSNLKQIINRLKDKRAIKNPAKTKCKID